MAAQSRTEFAGRAARVGHSREAMATTFGRALQPLRAKIASANSAQLTAGAPA